MTTLANINFEDVALAAVRNYGFSIIPRARGKEPLEINGRKVGAFARTNTEEGVRAFAAQVPADSNYSICSDENFYILESDDEARFRQCVRDACQKLYGAPRELPETLTSYGRTNRPHWFFKRTCEMNPAPKVHGLFECRFNNQYVAGFGSIHPVTGEPYRLVREDAPIVDFPEWLPKVLREIKRCAPPSDTSRSGVKGTPDRDGLAMLKAAYLKGGKDPKAMSGLDLAISVGRHYTMHSLACYLHDGKRSKEELTEIIENMWDEYCVGDDGRSNGRPRPNEIEDIVKHVLKLKPCVIGGPRIFQDQASRDAFNAKLSFRFPTSPAKFEIMCCCLYRVMTTAAGLVVGAFP